MIFLMRRPRRDSSARRCCRPKRRSAGLTPDFLNKTVDLLAAPSEGMPRSSTTVSAGTNPMPSSRPAASGIVDNAKLKVGYTAGELAGHHPLLHAPRRSEVCLPREGSLRLRRRAASRQLHGDRRGARDQVGLLHRCGGGLYLYFTPADLLGARSHGVHPERRDELREPYFDESLMIGEQYDIASVSRPFEIRIDPEQRRRQQHHPSDLNGDLGGATVPSP